MKQKLFKKLACLALSGILSVSGVEIPAYASESLIMEGRTEIQTETTAEGTTETSGESTEISDELTETEVVPTETSDKSTETEIIPTETSDESVETEVVPTETSDESTETEIIPTETSDELTETEVVPTETSDESTESETMEEKTTETETDEETTETATDEETTETETEMAEKMTARAADEDGNVPTPQEAYEAMIALQSKFPEGMHWTDASSGTYTWKGGRGENGEIATMGTGCVNFAFQLSDAAFGTLPARMLKENEFEFADIHVGDILRISLGHSVIVLQVNDDSMVIAEGNYNQSIHWGRVVTKSEVEQSVHVLTRYPKGYIPPNNPDADTVIKEDSIQDDEGNPSGLRWKLTKSGTLTISGNGDMPDFNFGNPSVSNRPWNDNIGSIQKIIIEDGVTSIGSNAFRKCDVYSVSIPKSVKKIGNDAFRECRKISYVYLEGVVTIGERAFQSCDNIRGVTLPACINKIGSAAFFQCQELVSVGFDPNTQSVTVGDDIFNSCWRLSDVTLPKTMNQIGKNMFYNCKVLPGLVIPEGVTSIEEGAFASCSNMTTVFIPKSVTQIGIAAFANSALTTVYYGGSEAEWKNIQKIGDTAATLSNVTLFYNIDPEPRLTPDTKTVYKVGEAFDKDGSRVNIATKTISLSDKDVTGFDSKQEGITAIAVTLGKDIYEFDLLVVEEPSLTAKQGQKLEELTLPSNNYGTWSWSEDSKQTALTETGSYDYPVIFTPKDTEKFSVREDLQAHIQVRSETDPDPSVEIHLKRPSKTTYKLKEELDVSGGEITYGETGETPIPLTKEMTSGFDSDKQGISTVTVIHNENTATFDTLVVEEPSLTAKQGQKLEELTLPSNNYGTWSWSEDNKQTALTETGSYDYPIIFTPKDTEKFSVREDLQAHIKVQTTAQDPANPEEGLWIAPIAACTYTGIAVTPSVNVFYNDKKLTAGIDYTLLYQNNIKAASSDAQKAPTVIVKGKGNYAGTKKETFTIDKLTLTKDHLKIAANYPKNIKYTPIVTNDSNNILKAGRDYTLTYLNSNGEPLKKQPTTEGTYQIQIQGIGSCAGDFKYSYSISESGGATAINKGTAKIDSFTYGNGEPKVSLTVNDNTLISGTDYIVNFVNVGKKGTATATFIGIGNYTGTLKKNFKVQAAPIEENDISVPQTAAYAKGGAKPNVTVTVNGRSLVMNTDYTVLYKNNKKVGNIAKVVIKGKGNYSGSVTKTFNIEQQSLRAENIKIYVSDAQAGKNPAVTVYDANGKKLAVKSDYRTEIDKEKRKVTITAGKNGLYKDSVDKDYKELPKKQLVTSVTLKKTQPKSFEYTGKEIKLEQDWLTVKAGKTELGKNEFEIIGYVNNIQKGTATVIIKGCGEYGGIKMYNYKIKSKKLSQK